MPHPVRLESEGGVQTRPVGALASVGACRDKQSGCAGRSSFLAVLPALPHSAAMPSLASSIGSSSYAVLCDRHKCSLQALPPAALPVLQGQMHLSLRRQL